VYSAQAGWASDRTVSKWYEQLADMVGAAVEWILWACQVLPTDTYTS
jgi:hypothetical protein